MQESYLDCFLITNTYGDNQSLSWTPWCNDFYHSSNEQTLIAILNLVDISKLRFIDQKVTQDGFLSTNTISDHYLFISGLVIIVIALLVAILYYDK